MVTQSDKEFLKKYYNIDCSNYSEEQLIHILNKIENLLDENIKNKQENISRLKKEIMSISNKENGE